MNLVQDLEIKRDTSIYGDEEKIKVPIKSYLNVIEEKLQDVDEYYKNNLKVERKYGYTEIFRECPVVDWLKNVLQRDSAPDQDSSALISVYKVAISQNEMGEVDTSFQ